RRARGTVSPRAARPRPWTRRARARKTCARAGSGSRLARFRGAPASWLARQQVLAQVRRHLARDAARVLERARVRAPDRAVPAAAVALHHRADVGAVLRAVRG